MSGLDNLTPKERDELAKDLDQLEDLLRRFQKAIKNETTPQLELVPGGKKD